MDKKIKNILILQSAVMRGYRNKLFDWLSKKFITFFIFTNLSNDIELPESLRFINTTSKNNIYKYFIILRYLLFYDYHILITHAESNESIIAWLVVKARKKKLLLWSEHWTYPVLITDEKTKNYFSKYFKIIKWQLKHFITKRMQRSTNQFIAIGEKAFNHYLNNVPKERIICAPKYVEKYPEDTSNMRIQNFLEKNQQRKTILYSGRLMKIKGVEYLIKAFSELEKKFNNAMLLIIGEGELKTDLEMLSKELDVKNIEFWDWLKPEELNLLYKNCYVFVQPSIFIDYRYEVNGYSIYECMAYAKPIITTDAVGASPQFVKHGYNGFVVESANSEALMDVLVTLIESEDLAGIMGQRSKNIYDTEISLSGQIAAFRKAIQTI